MSAIVRSLLLVSMVAHTAIAVYLYMHRQPRRPRTILLWGIWLVTGLATLSHFIPYLLPEFAFVSPMLTALTLITSFTLYGQYIIADIQQPVARWWRVAAVVWLIVVMLLYHPAAGALALGWLILVAGLGGMATLLLGAELLAFYRAALPELANRVLLWIVLAIVFIAGVIMSANGLKFMGTVAVLAAVAGMAYGHVTHRVVDIHQGLWLTLRGTLLGLGSAVITYLALRGHEAMRGNETVTYDMVILGLVVFSTLGYICIWLIVRAVLLPIEHNTARSVAAAREYSQALASANDLGELVRVVGYSLRLVMQVHRAAMMLVTEHDAAGRVSLQKVTSEDEEQVWLDVSGLLYQRLLQRKALSQFDVDYGVEFSTLSSMERDFLRRLNMSAYAPIVVDQVVLGVLMCGPRLNDQPFYARDLDLLATLADQTGVALRHAQSLDELRQMNHTMQTLNQELEVANVQYARLDGVKTDFITIASHELRTPLAQIRGYVDIADTLNDRGMLDQEQMVGIVHNLHGAIERTEELIAAMLDVSQIDIQAMDLRFASVAPEMIIRTALDPLLEHIRQRKLTLSARGLRDLPQIACDSQRLVQAFRNIITNGIKFTPDGGRIEINASLLPAEGEFPAHILVAITDSGVGIAAENLELIFEKFYRAADLSLHSTGAYKFLGAGPGLGLTIARGVIEGHGGQIWAESVGHDMQTCPGSTFYVRLPLVAPVEKRRVLIEEGHSDPTQVRRPGYKLQQKSEP